MTGIDFLLVLIGFPTGYAIGLAAGRFGEARGAPEPISPLLVGSAGALVALAAALFGPVTLPMLCLTVILGWCLLALAVIDLKTFLLPDGLNLAVFLLGCAMVAAFRQEDWPWHLAGALAGYGLLWLIETLYRRFRRREGLGRGDAKLLGAIGMWVGIEGLPPVLLIASLSGILAVIARSAIWREPMSGQTAIAFGPWIALGGYAVWLAGPAWP